MPDRVTALCPFPPGTLWQVYAYRAEDGTIDVAAECVVALAAVHKVVVCADEHGGVSEAGLESDSGIQLVRVVDGSHLDYFEESPECRIGLCSGQFVPEDWIERARLHVEGVEMIDAALTAAKPRPAGVPGPSRCA